MMQLCSNACSRKGYNTSKLTLKLSCVMFLIFMAFRNQTVGVDTKFYCSLFQQFQTIPINRIFTQTLYLEYGTKWTFDLEPGYRLFNKVLSLLSHSEQTITIANAVLITALAYRLIKDNSVSYWLSIWLYMTLGFFQSNMNIARGAIATLICCNAVSFLKARRWKTYTIIVLLASTIHMAALVYLVLYWFINHAHLNLHRFAGIIALIMPVGLTYGRIAGLLKEVFPGRYGQYLSTANMRSSSVLVGVWFLFIFAMMFLFMTKTERKAFVEEDQCSIWMLTAMTSCYCLALGMRNGERLAAMFSPYMLIAIPSCLSKIRESNRRNRAGIAIVILCGVQYFLRVSINNIGGSIPYDFFWQ